MQVTVSPGLVPGSKVWIRNPYPLSDESYRDAWLPSKFCSRPVWVPAEVVSFSAGNDNTVHCTTLLHPKIQIRISNDAVLPMNSVTGLDDVSEFVNLHEAAIVYNLTRRYLEGRPFTKAGPSVYMSLNPCRLQQDGDGISTTDLTHMARYRARLSPRSVEALPPAMRAAASLPPHIFEIADLAYTSVMATEQSTDLAGTSPHTIVFLGEQGAGKTECLKHALQYLVCVAPLAHASVRPGVLSTSTVRQVLQGMTDADLQHIVTNNMTSMIFSTAGLQARLVAQGNRRKAASIPSLPPLLEQSDTDQDYARKDAQRRKGPLGSARNPWVIHPPSLAASPVVPAAGVSVPVPSTILRSTDFYSDASGPSLTDRRMGSASGAASTAGSAASGTTAAAASVGTGVPASYRQIALSVNRVGRVLLAAQTVLEAFGCAATPGNAHSSRFVRAISLTIGGSAGDVTGARVQASLLDSRRVLGAAYDPRVYGLSRAKGGVQYPGIGAGMPPAGRNFHIFYQLLAGASRETRIGLQVGTPSDYLCLQQPKWAQQTGSQDGGVPQHVHGIPLPAKTGAVAMQGSATSGAGPTVLSPFSTALNDGEELSCTVRALEECDIDPSTQVVLFRLLSAVLISGNIKFTEAPGPADGSVPGPNSTVAPQGGAVISTPTEVSIFADLLSVDRSALSDTLCKRLRGSVQPGHGGGVTSTGVAWQWRKAAEARQTLDALVVGLYERIFAWLVARVNAALARAAAKMTADAEAAAAFRLSPLKDGRKPVRASRHDLESAATGLSTPSGSEDAARERRLIESTTNSSAGVSTVPDKVINLIEAPGLEGGAPMQVDAQMAPSASPYAAELQTQEDLAALGPTVMAQAAASGTIPPVVVDVDRIAGLDAFASHYAAERLADTFADACFRSEMELAQQEGIECSRPLFEDSAREAMSVLCDRRAGMLTCLDDALTQARTTDSALAAKMQSMLGRSSSYVVPMIATGAGLSLQEGGRLVHAPSIGDTAITTVPEPGGVYMVSSAAAAQDGEITGAPPAQGAGFDPSLLFAVRHSDGTVFYTSRGWLAHARASAGAGLHRADADLLTVMATTGNTVLAETLGLLPVGATKDGVSSESKRRRRSFAQDTLSPARLEGEEEGAEPALTLPIPLRSLPCTALSYGQALVESVDDALGSVLSMMRMTGAGVTFVRCMRPNSALQPTYVDSALVHSQVAHSNILHAVAARHTGFPARMPFSEFYERYILVVQGQEDDSERTKRLPGVPPTPRRLVFPPPRTADVRELCRELLSIVSSHPVFAAIRADMRSSVQFGRSLVFMKGHIQETLEALREVRLASMDNQATRLQAVWKGYSMRKRVKRIKDGASRLQAAWLAAMSRQHWRDVRSKAIKIQAAYRGHVALLRYKYLRGVILRLQRWIKALGSTRGWRRVRKGLRQLHALGRGFIVRCHVMRMLVAVVKIQSAVRMFIIRARVMRYKHAVVRLLQAAWRGRRFRLDNEDFLASLAHRREMRVCHTAASSLQALWRAASVRQEYKATKARVVFLQRWFLMKLSRKRLARQRAAAVRLQAFVRGALARKHVEKMRTLHAVADELWRVHNVRKLELAELSRFASEEAVLALPPSVRGAVASSIGVGVGHIALAPSTGSSAASAGILPPRVIQVTARPSTSSSDGTGLGHAPFTATTVLDVDAIKDTLEVHSTTLTRCLTSIERDLRASGTRLSTVALGSTHALALTESGHVYAWGFGDRGQVGHGRWAGESAPKLLDALLSEKELLSAQDRAAPAQGSSKGTPSKPAAGVPSHTHTSAIPASLLVPLRIKAIAAGDEHSMALSDNGRVFTWGNGRRGALGLGSWDSLCTPSHVRLALKSDDLAALPAPLALTAGSVVDSAAPSRRASVQADGAGSVVSGAGGAAAATAGVLGTGQGQGGPGGGEVVLPDDLTRVVEIAAGSNHSVALTSSGLVFTWGNGACLGSGVYTGTGDVCSPCVVRDLVRHRVRHVTSGPAFVAVVTSTGDVYTWGVGKEGQLGVGEDVYKVTGSGGTGKSSSSGGQARSEGEAKAEESLPVNGAQPGMYVAGRFRPRYRPTLVEGFASFDKHSRISAIAAGARHMLAVSSTGRVFAWGSNSHGQLGLGVPGPLPEAILRKSGVPLPTLPLADRLGRPSITSTATGEQGQGQYVPRPYVAVPAWVWTLDQQHVTSIAAGARSSAVLTDRKEVFAWGASYATSTLVDSDALLLRAYACLRGVPIPGPGTHAAGRRDSSSSDVPVRGLTVGQVTVESFPPVQMLESGRGPLDLNVVAAPQLVPLQALPGRTPKRLSSAFGTTGSVLCLSYTQQPMTEGQVRDVALARAVAPMTAAGAVQPPGAGYTQAGVPIGNGTPPLAVLAAGALADIDTSTPLPKSMLSQGESRGRSGAQQGMNVPPYGAALPDRTVEGLRVPASPQSNLPVNKAGRGRESVQAVASPAVTLLTALVAAGRTPGAQDRKAVQDAVYRGIVGSTGIAQAAANAGTALAGSAFKTVPSSGATVRGGGGGTSADGGRGAQLDGSSGAAQLQQQQAVQGGNSAVENVIPAAYAASVHLHPSIVELATALSADPAACAALLNLSSKQLKSMSPAHVHMVVARLMELSGVNTPGQKAAKAAQKNLPHVPHTPAVVKVNVPGLSAVSPRGGASMPAAPAQAQAPGPAAVRAAAHTAASSASNTVASMLRSIPATSFMSPSHAHADMPAQQAVHAAGSTSRGAHMSASGIRAGGQQQGKGSSSHTAPARSPPPVPAPLPQLGNVLSGGLPNSPATRAGAPSASASTTLRSPPPVPSGRAADTAAKSVFASGTPQQSSAQPFTVRSVLSGVPSHVLPSSAQSLVDSAHTAGQSLSDITPGAKGSTTVSSGPVAATSLGPSLPSLGAAFPSADYELLLARDVLAARVASRHGSPEQRDRPTPAVGPSGGDALAASSASFSSPGLAYALPGRRGLDTVDSASSAQDAPAPSPASAAFGPLTSSALEAGTAKLGRDRFPDLEGLDEDQALRASLEDMQKRMDAAKMRAAAMAAMQHAGLGQ